MSRRPRRVVIGSVGAVTVTAKGGGGSFVFVGSCVDVAVCLAVAAH